MKKLHLAGALLLFCAFCAATIVLVPTTARPAPSSPNIVVIMTDDQRWDTLSRMPNVQRLLQQQGTTYTNGFVPNSLCCPSRATTLTGLNARTTGCTRITPPFGGFASFKDQTTIATGSAGKPVPDDVRG